MKKIFVPLMLILILSLVLISLHSLKPITLNSPPAIHTWWQIQSIDTMKYSRDLARQGLKDPEFPEIIANQVSQIATVGANFIAIDTPYDDEFLPFLEMWVTAARKNFLHIWFRGNWSGWEGWFSYPKISRADHLAKTKQFIENHPDLFADGDIFSACPECENGGPGSPQTAADIADFRQFLLDEYQVTKNAFAQIRKNVRSNFLSMNADVARQVMDQETTASLGGIITIDHYVKNPGQYAIDIENIARKSGGQIMLGEFGAPIPDITGSLTAGEQALWLHNALDILAAQRVNLIGINYWVNVGGSTQIWDDKGQANPIVPVLHDYFLPPEKISLRVADDLHKPVSGVPVNWLGQKYETDTFGRVDLPYLPILNSPGILVGGNNSGFSLVKVLAAPSASVISVTISPQNPGIFYRIGRFFVRVFGIN